jgi:hypothetical protein
MEDLNVFDQMDYDTTSHIDPPAGNDGPGQESQEHQTMTELPEPDPTTGIIPDLERMNIDGGRILEFERSILSYEWLYPENNAHASQPVVPAFCMGSIIWMDISRTKACTVRKSPKLPNKMPLLLLLLQQHRRNVFHV